MTSEYLLAKFIAK